jgi:hypothetical protein
VAFESEQFFDTSGAGVDVVDDAAVGGAAQEVSAVAGKCKLPAPEEKNQQRGLGT